MAIQKWQFSSGYQHPLIHAREKYRNCSGKISTLTQRPLDITKTGCLDESEHPIISTPKTKKSIRKISLDDGTLDELKKRRMLQAEYYQKHGYNTMRPSHLIVPSKTNGLYNPTFPNDGLNMLSRKYDFKRITLHGFRYTHCSLLFEIITPLEEVQYRHSVIKTSKRQ